MTESKIEKIIREVSFAAQCAEMALWALSPRGMTVIC